MKRFDNEFEPPDSQAMVPKFEQLVKRLAGLLHLEEEHRAQILKQQVEAEIREADPDYEANQKEAQALNAKLRELIGDSEEED